VKVSDATGIIGIEGRKTLGIDSVRFAGVYV
jgi:hypothetical protein